MIFILCAVLLNPLVSTLTTAAKSKSVNLNLETVLEFDNKNLEKDVQIIDNVQTFLHKVRSVLDKSKDYRRSFHKGKVNFTDFVENVLSLLVTFNDDELEEFAVVIDEELRKYHYKGCKFYELVKNQKIRDLIGDALEEMRRTPVRKIRKLLKRCLEKLQNRDFSRKDTEFVNYVNSLYYRGEAKEKINNAFKRLEDFSKTGRRAHSEMVQVVRNAIRTIIFDHYSDLNANARKDFRLKIENFFIKYPDEDDKIEKRETTFSSQNNDGSKTKQTKVKGKKRRRNTSTTDIAAKDVKFIIETTTKSVTKRQKTVREKASITHAALRYKLSSEEDKDDKIGSISQKRDDDIIDEIKTKPITREELKPAHDKIPSKDVSLKYKLSSEEDKDDKIGSISQKRDDDIIDEIKTKPITREELKPAHDKIPSKDVSLKYKLSSEEDRDDKKGSISQKRDDDVIDEIKTKPITREKLKPAQDKIPSKDVSLKYKLSSEEDRDDKKGSMSRDIDVINDTTKKPIKRERPNREKTSSDNMKKKRSEKGKHGKKESKHSDMKVTDVTASKHIKRKKHKSSHTTKNFTPIRIYSSTGDKDDKIDVDTQTKINKSSTANVSLGPYPVRDLDEEKKRMPLRFLSLFPETIPTTTEKLRPKKDQKLKKHKRSKSLRMRAESVEEPNWQSSEPKKKKHSHRAENKPKTKMVVKEGRALREILTEHNAIFKTESPQPTHTTKKKVEKKKEHRKRKHSRISKPKLLSQKSSKLHENHAFEMSPVSTESDTIESKTQLRKHFSGYGLAIESFETNALDGHFKYRKQNYNDTFSKRSSLRRKAKQEKEEKKVKYRKAQYEREINDKTTRTHKKRHKSRSHVTDSSKTDIQEIDKEGEQRFRAQDAEIVVTTTTSRVTDDYIINKIHNLEKQLENVISKMDDNTESESSTSAVTIKATNNINHSTASVNNMSLLIVVNKDRIYENEETTPIVSSLPFWHDTPKTAKVVSYSSEQDESDNETVFGSKIKNKTIKTELSSPTVFIANKTDKASTSASSITTLKVESDDHIASKDSSTPSKYIYKSTATLKNTVSSSTIDTQNNKSIRKTLEVDDGLHDRNNATVAKSAKLSVEKDRVYSEEVNIKDKASTKNDARKVNKAVTLLPTKFKSINVNLIEVETKTTSKKAISTNKVIKVNNTKIKSTMKEVYTKPTQAIKVTATKTASTTSANQLKLNVTLPKETKLRTDSNKTNAIKDLYTTDKGKTNKLNATVATIANLNGTTPCPTTPFVSKEPVLILNADNSTNATTKKRRRRNFLSPLDVNEEDWEKNRESSDLLYNWA